MAEVGLTRDLAGKTLTVGVFGLVLSALFPFTIAFVGSGALAYSIIDEKKK